MVNSKILIYDGSFNGFLTVVFLAFEKNIQVVDIQKNSANQNGLFTETKTIFTNLEKAKRVWHGIQKKNNIAIKNIYFAYQSKAKGVELLLFKYIKKMYEQHETFPVNSSNPLELKIQQLANNVRREKQHIEAFSRFQTTEDAIRFLTISPTFDTLPLLSKHYRSKNNEQQWLIYDIKRNYGIFYDLEKIEIISLDLQEFYASCRDSKTAFAEVDYSHQELLDIYFKHTAIKPLINKKLHKQQIQEVKEPSIIYKREAVYA